MYCKKCKKEIEDNNSYCPYCGSRLVENTNKNSFIKKVIITIAIFIILIILYVIFYKVQINKGKQLLDQEEYYKASESVSFLFPKNDEIKVIETYSLMSSYSLAEVENSLVYTHYKLFKEDEAQEDLKNSLNDYVIGLQLTQKYIEKHSGIEKETAKQIQEKYYNALDENFKVDKETADKWISLEYNEMKKEINNHAIVFFSFIKLLDKNK